MASVTYVDNGTPADRSLFEDFLTVDRFFLFLEQTMQQRPASLTVDYEGHFGYPISVSVDFRANIADDEFSFRTSGFTPAAP